MKQLIGYLILSESKTFRQTFECAAWFQDVVVPPGKYPLYGSFNKEGQKIFPTIKECSVVLNGIKSSSDFRGRFCGNLISKDSKVDEGKGEPAQYHFSIAGYVLARLLLEGSKEFELVPEFRAEWDHYDYMIGERRITGTTTKITNAP